MGIGKRLKEARENAGLTQEELGRMIGVTGSAITNYEKETSHPKEPVMYALINALKVEPNFLFQDCVNLPPKEKSPSATKVAPGDDVSDIFSLLNSGLVSLGLLGEDEDITERQAEILISVSRILHATFNKS